MKIDGKIGLYKRKIGKIFKIAEEVLGEDFENAYLSVNFVSDEKTRGLNREFRKIDKVTDVLSFPNLQKKAEESLKNFQSDADFDTNMLFLGDVVISKNVAKAQAREFGHSMKREVCFLALHGLLHLLGYDHIEKGDEKIMNKLQDEILLRAGV